MKDILYFRQLIPNRKKHIFRFKDLWICPLTEIESYLLLIQINKKLLLKLIPDLDKANKEWKGLSLAYLAKVPRVPTPLIFGMTENKLLE